MSGIGDAASGVMKGILSGAKDLRAAITGKETLSSQDQINLAQIANQIELAAMQAEKEITLGQIETNKIEAQSDSFFKSGWRPATGWVCVSGLFYQLILRNIIPWAVQTICSIFEYKNNIAPLPSLELETLMTLLFGILGLGGYRMYEKTKGAR